MFDPMKIKSLIILFLMFAGSVFPSQFQDLIEQGNKYYRSSEFRQAIDTYNKILDQNVESAGIYYNLGNSYFRLGSIGKAILYYEKALKLNPDDEDINYNLKIAQARTVDKINELPEIWIADFWNSMLASFSIYGWSTVLILVYLLFLSSVGFYILTRNFKIRRLSFLSGSILLPAMIVVTILFISKIDRETSSEFGILIENTISAKLSPDEKSDDAFVIHEGVKFSVEDSFSDWSKIKLADGKVGWLPVKSFEII